MHRNKILILLVFVLTVTALASCEIEGDDNGKLDGYWHLVGIDSLDTSSSADLADSRIFWAFQGKLLWLSDESGMAISIFARFKHSGDTLLIYEPRLDDRVAGSQNNPLIEHPDSLMPYGIQNVEEKFIVEGLSSKHLTLRSATLRLKLRKM